MVNLVDVELKDVKALDGSTVPGACATCGKCGHAVEVARWQDSAGTKFPANGRETKPKFLERACEAVASECPETTGPKRKQSFPHTYFVAAVPESIRLLVRIRGKVCVAQIYGKKVATAACVIEKQTDVWVEYASHEQKQAVEVINRLSKLGYYPHGILAGHLENNPHAMRETSTLS